MGMTILNQKVENAAAIEQVVNSVIELAKEQGITSETEVDSEQPLTLGVIEFAGMHTETHPEVDMTHVTKPEGPKPN